MKKLGGRELTNLLAHIDNVVVSADPAGCGDGLTVASKSAIEQLAEAADTVRNVATRREPESSIEATRMYDPRQVESVIRNVRRILDRTHQLSSTQLAIVQGALAFYKSDPTGYAGGSGDGEHAVAQRDAAINECLQILTAGAAALEELDTSAAALEAASYQPVVGVHHHRFGETLSLFLVAADVPFTEKDFIEQIGESF